MRLLNGIVAVLATTTAATYQKKSLKTETSNLIQPNDAVLTKSTDTRLLRAHDINDNEEERVILLDKLFGWDKAKVKAAELLADQITNKFGDLTLTKMLQDKYFKTAMFKKWDSVKVEEIRKKLAQAARDDESVAMMIVEYVKFDRVYRRELM